MLRSYAMLLSIGAVLAWAPLGQSMRSGPLAKQLRAALLQQKLEVVAAQDPDEPDRFIAAAFVPNTQLLVVSARYGSPPLLKSISPPLLKSMLSQKRYSEVLPAIAGAPVPNSSLVFQDRDADGLRVSRERTADVVYNGTASATVFDGNRRDPHSAEEQYERLAIADEEYSRLLELLLAQLQGS